MIYIQNIDPLSLIEERVQPDSIVYNDSYRICNTLDVSDFKHYRVNHSKLFSHKENHTNGLRIFEPDEASFEKI